MVELSRRGFLAGLLGTAVIAVIPKAVVAEAVVEPIDPWAITAPARLDLPMGALCASRGA